LNGLSGPIGIDFYPTSMPAAKFATEPSEVHVAVAPVYPEVYTKTYAWNKLMGVAGQFVDAAKQESQTTSFLIPAPPRPSADPSLEMRLIESEVVKTGNGSGTMACDTVPGGFKVTIHVSGTDVLNPMVYKARYTAAWVQRNAPDSQFVSQSVP
jgi:hypothetical protein